MIKTAKTMVIELNEDQKRVIIEALSLYNDLFCTGDLDVSDGDIEVCEDVIEMITNSK